MFFIQFLLHQFDSNLGESWPVSHIVSDPGPTQWAFFISRIIYALFRLAPSHFHDSYQYYMNINSNCPWSISLVILAISVSYSKLHVSYDRFYLVFESVFLLKDLKILYFYKCVTAELLHLLCAVYLHFPGIPGGGLCEPHQHSMSHSSPHSVRVSTPYRRLLIHL